MLIGIAKAKINLFLNIVGKSADGYHLIESIFSKLSLADKIKVETCESISCIVDKGEIENNIVMRAAQKLRDFCGKNYGAKIYIEKNIPIAAGLGGGSADAAMALKLLIDLWDIQISNQELLAIALSLGADVPFCLQDSTCFVSGIGETLKQIRLDKELHLVLMNPGYYIMAGDAYHRIKSFSKSISPSCSKEELWELVITGHNDLTEAAQEICPELKEVRKILQSQKDVISVRMSGSGSTYFAIFPDKAASQKALENLQRAQTGWRIWQDSIWIWI